MPKFSVWPTPVGERMLRELQGDVRANAKKAMDDLERRGCKAADWRLEGDEVENFCVINLGRDWRMIIAFPESHVVAVLLIGRHLDRRPEVDVYRRLYDNLGIEMPTATERQGHPPCCETDQGPVDRDSVDRFIERERDLRRAERGRRRRTGRQSSARRSRR
jgi:hypothetical protein